MSKQAREAARARVEEIRREQARKAKRSRLILLGVGVVLVALIATAGAMIAAQADRTTFEALDAAAVPQHSSTEDGGIAVGADLTAGGANDGAPVIDVYFDYTCSWCAVLEENNADDLRESMAAGDLTVVYHPVSILDPSTDDSGFATRAAQASAAVADASPEHFVAFHEGLFGLWSAAQEAQAEPSDADIEQLAGEVGIPGDVASTLSQGRFAEWVEAATVEFDRAGYTGTPTVLVDGEPTELWVEPGQLVPFATGS